MAIVSGMLRVGEAQGTIRTVGARQRGPLYLYYGALFGLMAVGAGVGEVVNVTYLGDKFGAGIPAGLAVGWLIYVFGIRRFALSRFRKRLASRGIQLDLPLQMETTADALIYDVGGVRTIARWSSVTELFASRGYWIFLAQSTPLFAPKRFFTNEEAERSFVAAALAYMTEAARTRSPEAAAFAASS